MITSTRDHIPELDGLRGIAVLLVLRAHLQAGGTFFFIPPVEGEAGVDLFFVLSGFLITRILLYNREHGISLWHFWVRRAGRIFPLFYAFCFIGLFLYPDGRWGITASYLANYARVFGMELAAPVGHTWSLSVEEHFYVIWPLVILLLPAVASGRVAVYGVILIVVAAFAWEFQAARGWSESQQFDMIKNATHVRAMSLLSGAVVAHYEKSLRNEPSRCLIVAGLCLAAPIVWGIALSAFMPNATSWDDADYFAGTMLLSTAVLLVTISGRPFWWSALLRDGRLCYIGKISYGLYLLHYPIYIVAGVHGIVGEAPAWRCWVAVAVTFAVAHASFHLFESPVRLAVNHWADEGYPLRWYTKSPVVVESSAGSVKKISGPRR